MPIDASIYNNVAAQPSVTDQLAGVQKVQIQGQQIQQGQFQQQQQQQALKAQQVLDQVMKASVNPDGTINRDAIRTGLFNNNLAHTWPAYEKTFDDMDEAHAKLAKANADADAATKDAVGSTLRGVVLSKYAPGAALAGIAALQANKVMSPDQAVKLTAQIQANPTPEFVQSIVDPLIGQSKTQTELSTAAARANKPTEASLAQAAAGGDATAQAALDKLKGAAKGSAEQDDNRYRGIQAALIQKQPVSADDLAWAKAYEKQKTLTVDTSASAASLRQAATQAAETERQRHAEDFTEAQAGRKEYTDKVATPYQTALTSAQTLRDTVAAAQGGNKVAANLQNLETAMAAIRSQGLNRINTVEIGAPASAGSLWDRIQGRVGSLTAGQPVPADLQKDMLQFAGILEKSATAKYQKGRNSLLQVYPGAKLPDESMTAGGTSVTVTAPNGKRYTLSDQAKADAFVADAKAKGLWK